MLLIGCAEEPKTILVFEVDTERAAEMGLLADGEQIPEPHFLVVVESDPEWQITGELLWGAFVTTDADGAPAVGFQFNEDGASRFQSLTTMYASSGASGHRSQAAIILNGEIQSAPFIEAPISGGVGIIHGRFTQAEVEALVDVLNSGALEYPLKLREVIAGSESDSSE